MAWQNRRHSQKIRNMTLATSKILESGVTVAIAGGALRDVVLDRPVKDIDIYVPNHWFDRLRNSEMFGRWEITGHRWEIEGQRQYGESKIVQTWNCVAVCRTLKTLLDGISKDINVISMDMPNGINLTDLFKTFDLGICKIATTHYTGLVYGEDFQDDAYNEQMTLVNASQRHHVLSHYMRLAEKYPDWPLVIRRD